MKRIKKMNSCILAVLMCLSVVGCNNEDNRKTESTISSFETANSVIETTEQQTENDISPEGNIEKMLKFLEGTVDMSKFTLNEDNDLPLRKTYTYIDSDNAESTMQNIIQLEDGNTLQPFVTTINDLVASGYTVKKVGDNGEVFYRIPVTLEKDGKKLQVDVSGDENDIYSAVVRNVGLRTDENYVNFDFYGATKDSNFYSILSLFDSPTSLIGIQCDANGENCIITLGYWSMDQELNTFVHFYYDPKTDQATFHEIYIST